MTTAEVLLLIIMVAAVLLSFFVILPWRVRAAIYKVLETFREYKATSPDNAITHDELGIHDSPSMFYLRLKIKDFKKDALDALINTEIIQVTEDGKYYLSEDKLMGSKIYKRSYRS